MNHPEAKQRRLRPAVTGPAHFALFTNLIANLIAVCLILAMNAPSGQAQEFHNALSLQGFTGLLNTPNAEVTDEGKAYLLYSNQKEDKWRDRTPRQETYMFSVGLFSVMEVGGRLTEAPGAGVRDLSANFKVRVPFIPRGTYFPQVALGMQDAGGGAKQLQTKYVVATEEWWRFRFSLGYGKGPDRMDGVFGGVELKTFEWLYLIGEHDTKDKNLGIRFVSPDLFGLPVNLQATAKTSLDYRAGHMEYGIGIQIPLGFDDRRKKPRAESRGGKDAEPDESDRDKGEPEEAEAAVAAKAPEAGPSETGKGGFAIGVVAPAMAPEPAAKRASAGTAGDESGKTTPAVGPEMLAAGNETLALLDIGDGGLRKLREKLVADGFQNVRIGADGDKTLLVIEYENVRYNYNELDGLGVVGGMAVATVSPGFEMIQLVVRKKGIRVLQVCFTLLDFKAFLKDPGNRAQFNAGLEMTADVKVDEEVRFIDGDANANPSWLNSELIIYPGLKTFVGTEVGLVDYLLSVKPDYYLNTWKGAVLNARWDIPVKWSENFEEGKAFRNSRDSSKLERVMLHQAVKVAPTVMFNLGAGLVLKDTYGTINEVMWTPGGGNHRFMLKHAYLSSTEKQAAYQGNRVYLGAYRYFFGPLDLYLEGTAGQFLDNDRGFTVELKRFFGDTAFSLFYKNSKTEAKPGSPSEHVQMGGAQISFPLTLRKDMKPLPYAKLQVKGANEWGYSQETKIVSPGSANSVNTSIGLDPVPAYNLERVFYNRDRLSEDYIREHLNRIRDAALTLTP